MQQKDTADGPGLCPGTGKGEMVARRKARRRRASGAEVRAHRGRGNTDGTANPIRGKAK